MRTKNAALSACPSSVAGVVTWAADVAGAPGTCTGTFIANATWTPAAGVSSVTYLVVGGGGGGYSAAVQSAQRGGSGGQVRTGSTALGAGAVTVVVGAGGASTANGNSSSFSQGGVALVTASGGLTNAGPWGAGANGTTSSITGTAVIYGSSGGLGGGYAGGSGAGSGAAVNAGCAGGLSGTANRGGGGGGGVYYVYSMFDMNFPCYTIAGAGGSGASPARIVVLAPRPRLDAEMLAVAPESIEFTERNTGLRKARGWMGLDNREELVKALRPQLMEAMGDAAVRARAEEAGREFFEKRFAEWLRGDLKLGRDVEVDVRWVE